MGKVWRSWRTVFPTMEDDGRHSQFVWSTLRTTSPLLLGTYLTAFFVVRDAGYKQLAADNPGNVNFNYMLMLNNSLSSI